MATANQLLDIWQSNHQILSDEQRTTFLGRPEIELLGRLERGQAEAILSRNPKLEDAALEAKMALDRNHRHVAQPQPAGRRDRHVKRDKTLPGNAGWFARHRARQRDASFLNRNRRLLSGFPLLLLFEVAVAGLVMWLMPVGGAVIAGAMLGCFVTACFYELRMASGSAAQHRAADVEISVHEQIKKHLPPGWSVRSGIAWKGYDLDHLIVGDTMVIEVETKSTGGEWKLTADGVRLFAGDPTLDAARRLKKARQFITQGRSDDINGASWLVVAGPTGDDTRLALPALRNGVTVGQITHLGGLASGLPAIHDPVRAAANVARVDQYLGERSARVKQERVEQASAVT